jgi:hypothetical protein
MELVKLSNQLIKKKVIKSIDYKLSFNGAS